jgi:hypothetical protein
MTFRSLGPQRELVKAKGDADTSLVKEGLVHKQAEILCRSALALGQRNSAASTDALLNLLKADREDAVRAAAARALGEIPATGERHNRLWAWMDGVRHDAGQ